MHAHHTTQQHTPHKRAPCGTILKIAIGSWYWFFFWQWIDNYSELWSSVWSLWSMSFRMGSEPLSLLNCNSRLRVTYISLMGHLGLLLLRLNLLIPLALIDSVWHRPTTTLCIITQHTSTRLVNALTSLHTQTKKKHLLIAEMWFSKRCLSFGLYK